MLTRKPLTITVMVTHQRWDGLAGSNSLPVPGPGCDRAGVSGRAMVTAYPWFHSRLFFIRPVAGDALFETVHHPTKAPAVEIDVLVHPVAVEWLLLHKRPDTVGEPQSMIFQQLSQNVLSYKRLIGAPTA